MIPKSFSATALQVAELCMARYKAEQIDRARAPQDPAAKFGSALHGALEHYVKSCIINKMLEPTFAHLLEMWRISFMTTYATSDITLPEYTEGAEILGDWYKRNDFSTFTVISCEEKDSIPIPTTAGEIPFNYIWDRFDDLGDGVFRVVDYKSNRAPFTSDQLRKKIQSRAYGLIAQIKYPEAKQIIVDFDMLRHNGTVGIVLSREDNIATWRFLKAAAQKIVDTAEEDIEETPNSECLFCVRKISCEAIRQNAAAGGIFSMNDPVLMVEQRAKLEYCSKALNAAMAEMDAVIIKTAEAEDRIEWESPANKMRIGSSGRRNIDPFWVQKIVGPEVMAEFGAGINITLANVDKMLKSSKITDEQKKQIRGLIGVKYGDPRVYIESKSPLSD